MSAKKKSKINNILPDEVNEDEALFCQMNFLQDDDDDYIEAQSLKHFNMIII